MATTKITDLTAYTDPISTDVVPIVDVTSDVTKKVSIADLMENAGSGTEALPGISFDGDPNTGIYRPGADQVAISTGGTGRLFIDASGNVAVGNPTTNNRFLIYIPGINDSYLQIGNGSTGVSATQGLRIGTPAAGNAEITTDGLITFGTGNSERLRIDSSGNVGIGTTSPVSALNVSVADGGNVTISSTNDSHTVGLAFGDTSSNTSGRVSYDHANNSMRFDTAGDERLRIDSSGNVGVGTSSPANYANFVTIALADTSGAEVDFIKGSTVQGSVYNAGDVFYIESKSTVPTAFVTNGSERARIDSSGNVGIGTAAPGALLDVTGSNGKMLIANGTTSDSMRLIAQNATGTGNAAMVFESYNLEYGRFDTSGRLLVGTSTNATTALLQVRGDSAAATNPGTLYLFPNYAPASLGAGDVLGRLQAGANDGSVGATIDFVGDATWGSGDYPTRLMFSTCAVGESSPTERMRIASNGSVQIGRTTGQIETELFCLQAGGQQLGYFYNYANADHDGFILRHTYAQSTQTATMWRFQRDNGTTVGTITSTATATAYNTTSDYRLKENIVPLTGAIDRLGQLAVHRFNFIGDCDRVVDGFLAHEAQAVVPESVTGTQDEVEVWKEGEELPDGVSVGDNKLDEDGNTIPVYQGIDQSKLVPLLTAALQEALAKIEILEQRLNDAGIA